ncbi:MAG: SpoIIE family protein phosphatase [Egibacteraceae bacterium]
MSTSSMEEVLAAGGGMGRLIGSIDWSANPIGSIKSWPRSLCTAVGICLSCPLPLLIWWGRELIMLYNDAYRPILGATKHPQSIGARGADMWPEIWDTIGPMLQGVLERGEAAYSDDLRLLVDRDGQVEERSFRWSFSPIREESGEVCGVFTLATETTHRGLVPTRIPELEHVAVSVRYLPSTSDVEVSGGWYDVVGDSHGEWTLFAVGDAMSRGVQAASTMGQLRNALRAYAFEGMRPGPALERLNQLGEGLGEGHSSTVLCLQFHARTGRLVYAAAGHPPPVLLRHDGSMDLLEGGRAAPIGVQPDTRYVEAEEQLAPGDTVLLYTDGLISSPTSTVDEGHARLLGALASVPTDLDALVDHVLETVCHARGDDDLAVLALRVIDRPVFVLERRLESTPVNLRGMRRELRVFLRSAGLREDDGNELIVAISEAAANAIEHPLKTTESSIELTVEVRDDEVVACVRDFGQWDDTDPEPDRGRGLILIRALADMDVRRHVDGTRVIMRRAVRGQS